MWRADEHEDVTDRAWDQAAARAAIAAVVADAEGAVRNDGTWPGHPRDELTSAEERMRSIYLGAGGMIWGLARLGSDLDAGAAIGEALAAYRAAPDLGTSAHPGSLWMGEAGLLAIAAALDSPAAERARLEALIRDNRDHPTWELMWGSPGTILAARALGLIEAWRESAERLWAARDEASGLWTQRMYGDVRRYLGPAHGFAGCVHALRGHLDDSRLRAHVAPVLEATAIREAGLVNWPPTPDAPVSAIRVQWCHGAPGILSLIGDLVPRPLLSAAAELVWRAGPLRKGPGLCHGTAGNGSPC